MQVTPATTYESMSAGPATLCAAAPVATKMPAPMMAPTPRLVSWTGPRTRRSRFSPAISSNSWLRDLVANSWPFMRANYTRCPRAPPLASSLEAIDVRTNPLLRILRDQQIRRDGHARRARSNHRGSAVECDSSYADYQQPRTPLDARGREIRQSPARAIANVPVADDVQRREGGHAGAILIDRRYTASASRLLVRSRARSRSMKEVLRRPAMKSESFMIL